MLRARPTPHRKRSHESNLRPRRLRIRESHRWNTAVTDGLESAFTLSGIRSGGRGGDFDPRPSPSHQLFPHKSRWPPWGILLPPRSAEPSCGPPRSRAQSRAAPCPPAAAFGLKSVNLASKRSTPGPFSCKKGLSVTSRRCFLARRRPASIYRVRGGGV